MDLSYKVAFVSLGCDKNLVDSEHMLGMLHGGGYTLTASEQEADVLVVNTCSFIEDAKKESIEQILEVARYKEEGNCKALIVTGCMAQRYKEEILTEMPEVDAVVGTTSYDQITEIVTKVLEQKGEQVKHFESIDRQFLEDMPRILTTAGYFAYIKIAEGCDNLCTYCIIPQLRGKYRSRSIVQIEKEVTKLAKEGVSELILVAQDTTRYGEDLQDGTSLAMLANQLSKIEGIEWIRILYCYPENLTEELILEMKNNPKVCHYLDIPIQHASNTVLKRMARKSTNEDLRHKMARLREEMPDIAIRTTLIVGFPGETEEEFNELYTFVKDMEFDRLGVFTYSREEGTPAAKMEDQIDEEVKQKRKEMIMALQQDISARRNQKQVGKTMQVLIEGKLTDEPVYIGRSYQDAPDIDGQVFVQYEGELISGEYVQVRITEASDYDLIGEVLDEYSE
jgi:ribosomal protein S12 methylthiotransferase